MYIKSNDNQVFRASGICPLYLPAGDVESGGPIYKGNSAAAHDKAPLAKPEDVKVKNKNKKPDGDVKTEEEPEEKKTSGLGRKEKSVLQAKLTKLAIQIGYAGQSSAPFG